MNQGSSLKDSQIIILGICIAVATIAASLILAKGFMGVVKYKEQVVTVTGSAQREIISDKIIWRASFSQRAADLPRGFKAIKEDQEKVSRYLLDKGLLENEIIVNQIYTTKILKKTKDGRETNETDYFILTQSIEIRSNKVDLLTEISRQSTELIDQNIAFESGVPEYYYSKLDELKVEMLALATENAKQRAENMVKATGNKIGFIRSARMGVFQITASNSTEISDYGINDTGSLDKKVTAVVNATFSIE